MCRPRIWSHRASRAANAALCYTIMFDLPSCFVRKKKRKENKCNIVLAFSFHNRTHACYRFYEIAKINDTLQRKREVKNVLTWKWRLRIGKCWRWYRPYDEGLLRLNVMHLYAEKWRWWELKRRIWPILCLNYQARDILCITITLKINRDSFAISQLGISSRLNIQGMKEA